MSKWNANFQLKRSKVKVTGSQKPPEYAAFLAHLFTYGAADQAPAAQEPTAN